MFRAILIVLGSFLAGAISAGYIAYRLGWNACIDSFASASNRVDQISVDPLDAEFIEEVKR
jgi:hypothetical protein